MSLQVVQLLRSGCVSLFACVSLNLLLGSRLFFPAAVEGCSKQKASSLDFIALMAMKVLDDLAAIHPVDENRREARLNVLRDDDD